MTVVPPAAAKPVVPAASPATAPAATKPVVPAARPAPAASPIMAAATLAGTVLTLLIVFALRQRHHFITSFWGVDSDVWGFRFGLQLAALVAGLVLLRLVPPRWSRWVVYAEGLVCLAGYGPLVAAVYAGLLLVYYFALELPLPKPLRLAMPIVLMLSVGLVADHLLPRASADHLELFSMLFHLRVLLYAWEKWQSGFPRGRLSDYALYFLSPPLLVFPPYMVLIPFYRQTVAKFAPRIDRAAAVKGLRHLGLGLVFTALALGLGWIRRQAGIEQAETRLEVYFVFIVQLAQVAGPIHLVYGLLTLHGFVDRVPIDRPLFSRTFVEFWQRFQIHQKDMQVAFFYNPVLLRFRRRNRYVAIAAAAGMTMLVGNFSVHYVVRYVYDWHRWSGMGPTWVLFDVSSFIALTATLGLAEWRRRNQRPAPKTLVWDLICWFVTFNFTAYLLAE